MIVLRSPKGWTGPKEVDGKKTEGFWRSHQVPMGEMRENPQHVKILEDWMKSYRPGSSSSRTDVSSPRWPPLRPRAGAGWAPTLTPMAGCS
jgi:xylulose-5-phosphate/fructose-6-phosphate phosphoketolase